jgi:hypothetical protein
MMLGKGYIRAMVIKKRMVVVWLPYYYLFNKNLYFQSVLYPTIGNDN